MLRESQKDFLTSHAATSNPRDGEVTGGITPEGRSPDIGWVEDEAFGRERGEGEEEDWLEGEGEVEPRGVLWEEKAGSMLLCASRCRSGCCSCCCESNTCNWEKMLLKN